MLGINYKDKRPIYEQLRDGIKELILKGVYPSGEKLPSVRELSISLTVNPNTVQRAYRELEAEGYIHSVAGKGTFVSEGMPTKEDLEKIYQEISKLVQDLMFYQEPLEKVLFFVEEIYKGGLS